MLSLLRKSPASEALSNAIAPNRPALPSGTDGIQSAETERTMMDEYAHLAQSLGIENPHINADLIVERFKAFLRKEDWAVFSLPTVISYMDAKSKAESTAGAGWHWRPLREKDNIKNIRFGKAAYQHQEMRNPSPASDYYHGPHRAREMQWSNNGQRTVAQEVDAPASATAYDKLVPLHALRKVAIIESEFPEPVSFFVCDYAPAPHIQHPDPFLMAVVNNARLADGVGRFVIDFWDEPGFGLEQQIT